MDVGIVGNYDGRATSVVNLDGRSEVIEAQGINLSQNLAQTDLSDECLGIQLPQTRLQDQLGFEHPR